MHRIGLNALVAVALLLTGCTVCCTIECPADCAPVGTVTQAGGHVLSEGEEVDVELSAVPANVMRAALAAVEGIVFEKAELEVENGLMVYELEGTADGKSYEVEVDLRGKVIEVESGEDDDDDHDDDDDDDDDDHDDDDDDDDDDHEDGDDDDD